MQYASRLPCGEDLQVEQVTLAQGKCRAWSWLAEAILILDFLVCVPAGVVIFGFLCNRCGDQIKETAQFECIIESSSESEDDWKQGESSVPAQGLGPKHSQKKD